MTTGFEVYAVSGIPLLEKGDDLAKIICENVDKMTRELADGDIVVVAQKAISKVEGRIVDLASIKPSERAIEIASQCGKDAREVELILGESVCIERIAENLLIVQHHNGAILANAGMDRSNVSGDEDQEVVLLLPVDADKSAQVLKSRLKEITSADVAVIISDSLGRPWRLGTTGVAIGVAGLPAILDLRGEEDLFGRELKVSLQAVGDELSAAAALVQGQGAEGQPVAIIRGDFAWTEAESPATALIRPKEQDLFR